ncbi:hypothetical protein B0H66DRAFT_64997 [Apodospora peruviana]|uniref:Uncharacterized protein n=1 Tax=Apodospora peruviana TaxID=516989 RepID=A0AAE0ISK6_9PEZI|nr:hypothetical protein B0H66DRAFT_64997 [Apodospora peruviana]
MVFRFSLFFFRPHHQTHTHHDSHPCHHPQTFWLILFQRLCALCVCLSIQTILLTRPLSPSLSILIILFFRRRVCLSPSQSPPADGNHHTTEATMAPLLPLLATVTALVSAVNSAPTHRQHRDSGLISSVPTQHVLHMGLDRSSAPSYRSDGLRLAKRDDDDDGDDDDEDSDDDDSDVDDNVPAVVVDVLQRGLDRPSAPPYPSHHFEGIDELRLAKRDDDDGDDDEDGHDDDSDDNDDDDVPAVVVDVLQRGLDRSSAPPHPPYDFGNIDDLRLAKRDGDDDEGDDDDDDDDRDDDEGDRGDDEGDRDDDVPVVILVERDGPVVTVAAKSPPRQNVKNATQALKQKQAQELEAMKKQHSARIEELRRKQQAAMSDTLPNDVRKSLKAKQKAEMLLLTNDFALEEAMLLKSHYEQLMDLVVTYKDKNNSRGI